MCVAVPARIAWIGDTTPAAIPARVESAAGMVDVDLVMVPTAQLGDYVVTHSGYAIRVMAPHEAAVTLRLLDDAGP